MASPPLGISALATAFLCMVGCIPAGKNSSVTVTGPAGSVFPQVSGINLAGEEVRLPDGFEGEANVVVLAFEREQQQLVDTWVGPVDGLRGRLPDLELYEVPTIYRANPAFRLWVNNGMRSGIPDPVARERTITVYVDRERFMEVLAIPDMSDIHVLLLDAKGTIQWRATGPSDEHKLASLRDALSEMGRWPLERTAGG